ncbi:glycosyltransferase [Humisphaera borealis]|uniref:Glycosyltransferase n=1 Tax=Humisphaera borealis TaxID=2807512 RepID=A0A7M2X2F4_9BACT|nr:glycosyltransferase [Humisphaera borealis]QOV91875.1 glycosyltransferase [Humisphaera borealis]
MRAGLVPQIAPCFISHNLALGGAQIAVLRMIRALPDWVRERTSLYVQADDMPLLEPAVKAGFTCKTITTKPIDDPSCYVLSYGNLAGLPDRPTSLLLHSWDDEGWRFINRAYGDARGWRVAGVSQQVLKRFQPWIADGGHEVAGVLPPPVTEFARVKGRQGKNRIVVAWMGRPLEQKGLFSLPYLMKLDPRIVVRCFTGAITGGHPYTRRVQTEAMEKFLALCDKLKVRHQLDLRPLDFDPFNYQERLRGCHVLLGNSRREGFLLTAAEALSCGVPVVVTRDCGVTEFITEGVNGCVIDWNEDPRKLAKKCLAAIERAAKLKAGDALTSAQSLSTAATYQDVYGDVLAKLTHTSLQSAAPRVTVGLRIHKGMRIDHLDQAASSLASQTYRNFKTVLLVDGPWEYGEQLAARYDLPLICTGEEPDITHCSWLHRQAVAQCDTEFYKPLDYDDQLLPTYLERAIAMLDSQQADVYGCLLTSLENDQFSARWWPNKPIQTMFASRNSDLNQLPHSSVLMRTSAAIKAGNYNERAVGLGADDYQLWYRLYQTGAKFFRDDDVRNVVYRIHEKNSLKIRKARYGAASASAAPSPVESSPAASFTSKAGKLITGAAAASLLLATPAMASDVGGKPPDRKHAAPSAGPDKKIQRTDSNPDDTLIPPHS